MPVIVNTTQRLVIRQLEPADAAFMLEMVNSRGWLQYIGDRNVHSVSDAESYLQKGAIASYQLNGFGLWMLEEKTSGNAIGLCGLIRRIGLDEVDLGFAILPGKQGKGFAFEAATASVQYARSLQLPKLVAITTPDNIPSISLLLKLGFTFSRKISLPGSTEVLNLYSLVLAG